MKSPELFLRIALNLDSNLRLPEKLGCLKWLITNLFPSKKRPLSSTKKDKFLKLKLVFKLPRYSSAKDRLLILPDQMVPSILV